MKLLRSTAGREPGPVARGHRCCEYQSVATASQNILKRGRLGLAFSFLKERKMFLDPIPASAICSEPLGI